MSPRKPKSHKADGTPKRRWTAAERAARGHSPRRRGGGSRSKPDTRREPGKAEQRRRSEAADDRFARPKRRPQQRRDRDAAQGQQRQGAPQWGRGDRDERRPGNQRRGNRFESEQREGRTRRKDWRDDSRSSHRDSQQRPDRRAGRGKKAAWRGRDEGRKSGWSHKPRRDDHRAARKQARPGSEAQPVADTMQWQAPDTAQAETTGQHTGFSELGVDARLVAVLASRGITEPFPIQRATMADVLAGRDVLGRGRTGSGKTLGFGLPMLQRLAHHKRQQVPAGLILSPTRELAMQIADELAGLAQAVELSLTLVAGGMAYGPQLKAFERGVDVVVATPGRLIDLLEQGVVDLSQIKMTVLDEADLMCDMGFYPDVTRIVDATPNGQRLLFSATLDDAVDRLVREYLHKPVTHEADVRAGSAMTHHLLHIAGHHKNEVTAQLATRAGQTLVFTRTQRGAERVAEQLREAGVLAGALHGGLTQGARARVMRAFRETKLPVLVATDVAARGIHVDDVALVLQVDPPMGAKDYVHRAGRTARAGAHGTVISLVLPHQRKLMRRLTGQAKVNAEQLEVTPGCDELVEIIGGPIEHREAVAESVYQELVAPPKPHGRGRRRGAPRRSRR